MLILTLFNGGSSVALEKVIRDMAWRDLVDYSITRCRSLPRAEPGRKTAAQ